MKIINFLFFNYVEITIQELFELNNDVPQYIREAMFKKLRIIKSHNTKTKKAA